MNVWTGYASLALAVLELVIRWMMSVSHLASSRLRHSSPVNFSAIAHIPPCEESGDLLDPPFCGPLPRQIASFVYGLGGCPR